MRGDVVLRHKHLRKVHGLLIALYFSFSAGDKFFIHFSLYSRTTVTVEKTFTCFTLQKVFRVDTIFF